MQTYWVLFQIAGGALLEILAGVVWVTGFPFPLGGALILPTWQGRQAAVPVANASVAFNPLVGLGKDPVASPAASRAATEPHWRQADGRFLWIRAVKVTLETFLFCTQLRACWQQLESIQKRSLYSLLIEHFCPRLWVKGQIFIIHENGVLNTVPSAKTTEIVKV